MRKVPTRRVFVMANRRAPEHRLPDCREDGSSMLHAEKIPGDLTKELAGWKSPPFCRVRRLRCLGASKLERPYQKMRSIVKRENRQYSEVELRRFLASADYLDLAEVFRQTVRDHRYFSFLREKFRRDVAPCKLHSLICKSGGGLWWRPTRQGIAGRKLIKTMGPGAEPNTASLPA